MSEPPPTSPATHELTAPRPPIHREGLSRPETFSEKLGYALERWLTRLALALLAIGAVLLIVIGIPLVKAMRSDEFGYARAFVESSLAVEEAIGGAVVAISPPRRYRFEPRRASLVFAVESSRGPATVDLVVEELEPSSAGRRTFRIAEARVVTADGVVHPIAPRRRR